MPSDRVSLLRKWWSTHSKVTLCDLCRLDNIDYNDPPQRDFATILYEYEQLLTKRRGRTQLATYTRRQMNKLGVIGCIEKQVLGCGTQSGFTFLAAERRPEGHRKALSESTRAASRLAQWRQRRQHLLRPENPRRFALYPLMARDGGQSLKGSAWICERAIMGANTATVARERFI